MSTDSEATADVQKILEWLWLEACHCTEATTSEDCPAHKKMETVLTYIRALEKEHREARCLVNKWGQRTVGDAKSIISHIKYEGHSTLDAEVHFETLKSELETDLSSFTLKA